jgi:hypothetical protein
MDNGLMDVSNWMQELEGFHAPIATIVTSFYRFKRCLCGLVVVEIYD